MVGFEWGVMPSRSRIVCGLCCGLSCAHPLVLSCAHPFVYWPCTWKLHQKWVEGMHLLMGILCAHKVPYCLSSIAGSPPPPNPLKGVTTAVSPSVLALRSEQGRDSFPRVATQPEKGRTTSSSARTKPGEGGQQGALRTSTQHGTPPSTQQQLAPMLRWSGESRNEVGGQRR